MSDTPAHRRACEEIAEWFKQGMLTKLLAGRNLDKIGWRSCSTSELKATFLVELAELAKAIEGFDGERVSDELYDVANLWSMIQDPKRVEGPAREYGRPCQFCGSTTCDGTCG